MGKRKPIRPSDAPTLASTRLVLLAGMGSIALAAVKITAGIAGNSSALIADGIESLTDVVSSVAVLVGITLSARPPDERHPWGHGKMETFATLFVAGALLLAAGFIAWKSLHEIRTPQEAPACFTLPVLVLVVGVKVLMARALGRQASAHGSTALQADSWHHLSDALTSGAAFIGISVALVMGPGWEVADDWAALAACTVILWNGGRLAYGVALELLETRAPETLEMDLRQIALHVKGVRDVEKLRARKSGMGIVMDIHIEVDPELTVRQGHNIAHAVKRALIQKSAAVDVTVHVEPHEPN